MVTSWQEVLWNLPAALFLVWSIWLLGILLGGENHE